MPLSYSNLLSAAFPKTPVNVVGNLASNLYDTYKIATKPVPPPMGMLSGALSGAAASVPAPQKPVVAAPPTSSGNKNSSVSAGNTSYYGNNYNAGANTQNKTSVPAAPTYSNDNQLGANPSNVSPNSNTGQNDVLNLDSLKSLYGVSDIPTYRAPDTSMYDKQINSFDPEAEKAKIQSQLDAELSNIDNRYQNEEKDVETQTENERQSQLSNLYNLGYVNPASSGVASIGLASKDVLNKRKDALSQARQAERSLAIKQAYGMTSDVQQKALTLAQQQKANVEKQATDSYANERQKWTDSVSQINNIVSLYKSGREINLQDKESAQKTINSLLSHGSAMFNGVPQEELAIMEKAAGYPKGSLVNGLKNLKEKELLDKDGLNLKEINGSLYNIKKDAYGNVVPELIVKGSSTSNSSMPASYKEFELTQSNPDYAQFLNKSKPQTADQLKAEGFANRLQDANTVISQLETTGAKLIGTISGDKNFPNAFKSPERQQLEQAERNFVNSILRRESGAAISPSEFDNATAQYFPQPGDSDEVIKQKSQNRLRAINNFQVESGKANQNNYDPVAIDELMRNGYSQEQINTFLQSKQSFNKPLSMGQNGSIAPQIAQKYPEGAKGGQCTTFLHSLVQFPAIGDGKLQKFASVDKFGISADQFRQNPRIGDVIVTGENKTYGHTAMINAILPNGFRVTESNFRGDERVTHDRIIPFNSPQIYGAIRGPLKV